MTSILIDSAGTPIIDFQGNMQTISGNAEFKQRLTNIFCTQKYSESLFPDYGFDYASLVKSIGRIDRSLALRSAAIEALDPKNVLDVDELIDLQAIVTGTTGLISLNLRTDAGQIITQTLQIGE